MLCRKIENYIYDLYKIITFNTLNYRVLKSHAGLSHIKILPRNVAEHEKHCL